MFKFFTPTTKVQKDRAIMRETDARLAKYSRRGLIFNFLAFLLCLTGGNFVEKEQGLAIVLTVGLLLFTLLRGFFLFRFETLYPRAPAKWRNNYFFATLLGATWWGVIMVSVTLVLQMQDVAPLLWLYTVVFFSTTAHAFAPYQRFLRVYQFVGQVPAAVAAFLVPDVNAWLYGVLLLAFYFMLAHQCRLMSEDYWQKLAATYALAKKTENLEEEKRGTRATAELNQEFMNNLHVDLGEVVELTERNLEDMRAGGESANWIERLEQAQHFQSRIYSSVHDFRGLINKELSLESRVFNVRHELQALISDAAEYAEAHNIEIESGLSPTIPMRLDGDAARFGQVIRTVLASVMHNASNAFVLVEADFLREFEDSGDLQVTVSRQALAKKRLFQPGAEQGIATNLDLSVCKGIADSMDGTLAVTEDRHGNHQIRFRAKFNVPEAAGQLGFQKDIFAGRSILMVHPNTSLMEVKRRELHALGLSVRTESQYRRAYQTLVNSYRENAPIESVLFYVQPHGEEALEFSQNLLTHKELRNTHQLVVCARSAGEWELVPNAHSVHVLAPPAGLYEMGVRLFEIFSGGFAGEGSQLSSDNLRLLYVDMQEGLGQVDTEQLKIAGAQVESVRASRLERHHLTGDQYDLVVMECHRERSTCAGVIGKIRQYEKEESAQSFLPIIGLGYSDVANFYEQGFDHFVNLNERSMRLDAVLRYWANQ
jgi:signal transduction histidine kinase